MKIIKEYSQLTAADRSIRTIIAGAPGSRAHWQLIHKTAGYECAGSCARYTGEAWGAIAKSNSGTTYGQWYKTEAEAREHFDRVSTPIIEIAAIL